MTVTATLVESAPNHLRYLIEADDSAGTTVVIPTTGGATPDLRTDSKQGPIKKLSKTFTDGFASFAAGVQTQAKSRALWLSDWLGADPAPGDPTGRPSLVTTAICRLTPRTTLAVWTADADIDVNGAPVLVVSQTAGGSGCASIVYTISIVLVNAPFTIGINAGDCTLDVTIEQSEFGVQATWGDLRAELEAAGYTITGGPLDSLALPAPPSTPEIAWIFEGTATCDDGLSSMAFIDIINTQGFEPPATVQGWLGSAGSFERGCGISAPGICYLDVFVPEAIG